MNIRPLSAAGMPPAQKSKIQSLETEIQQCYGTYMYCEAADFQSAEERETSRRMSQRMGEIARQLTELRGDSVLNRDNVKAQVEVVLERQPLARLGYPAFKAVYPHCRYSGYGVDDPAGRLHAAVRHGSLSQEQVDEKVLRSAARRKATAGPADEEVRQAAGRALSDALPRELDRLFPDLETFLAYPGQPGLADAVKSLVAEGQVELRPEDVNRWRRCIYLPGQLGGEARKFHEGTNRAAALRSMAYLLDQPDLPFAPEEREQALTCAAQSLANRPDEREKERWVKRGMTEKHLEAALLGAHQPALSTGAIGETPEWIVVGSQRVPRRP